MQARLIQIVCNGILLIVPEFHSVGICDDRIARPTPSEQTAINSPLANLPPGHQPLTPEGSFVVRLSTISSDYTGISPSASTPVILTRGATAVSATKSGPSGVAQLSGAREGAQSLLSIGPEGFGSSGVYLTTVPGMRSAPVTEIALVPASESKIVQELLSRVPQTTSGTIGQIVPLDELADAFDAGIPQYILGRDGSISGRCVRVERLVATAMPDIRVLFIRRGEILGEATSNEQGLFHISAGRLPPGLISVLAYGSGGYALYGAEIRQPERSSSLETFPDGTSPVAFQGSITPVTVNLSNPQSLGLFLQSAQSQFTAGVAGLPGGGTGAGTGGGGGSGGGGGGGGLLGLAGLAAGAAAIGIAAANENNDRPTSPASP